MSEELTPITLHPTESVAAQIFLVSVIVVVLTPHQESSILLTSSAVIALSLIFFTTSIYFRPRPRRRSS